MQKGGVAWLRVCAPKITAWENFFLATHKGLLNAARGARGLLKKQRGASACLFPYNIIKEWVLYIYNKGVVGGYIIIKKWALYIIKEWRLLNRQEAHGMGAFRGLLA